MNFTDTSEIDFHLKEVHARASCLEANAAQLVERAAFAEEKGLFASVDDAPYGGCTKP
jgi:hypothetical protein